MRRFIITESEAGRTSHAGFGLIAIALNKCADLAADAKAVAPLRSDTMSHAEKFASYIGLLCLGKNDFEAINGFREHL